MVSRRCKCAVKKPGALVPPVSGTACGCAPNPGLKPTFVPNKAGTSLLNSLPFSNWRMTPGGSSRLVLREDLSLTDKPGAL